MKNTIGSRLRAVRNLRKLTQLELAKKTGLQASAISHFEDNRRVPCVENLVRLCIALSVSSDHIIGLVEPRGPAVGELADHLLQSFGKLTDSDQAALVTFAAMLTDNPKYTKDSQ